MENFKDGLRKQKKKILAKILPPILVVLVRMLALLVRFEFNLSQTSLEKVARGEVFILAFWHGELLFQPYLFKKYGQNKAFCVLISQHFDGEIISGVIKRFGINSLRGSSSKGGIRALLVAAKKIESGEYIVITPDGPRGPYHSIADGIVFLSQKSNVPIVFSRIFYENAWELKTWDKFKIPKPFSKVRFVLGEPFSVSGMDLENAKLLIKTKMEQNQCAG